MNCRKIFETGLIILFAVMFGTCTYLYARPSVTVENTFETGLVNIGLDTYQIDKHGAELPWTDNPVVLPNAEISNIKRITNLGDDPCYIRAKVTFQGTDTMNNSNLLGISENWILKDDGYWYYQPMLRAGECTDLFTAIKIPKDVGNENQSLPFALFVLVEGLQVQNVAPDYAADSPWGDVVILKADTDGQNIINSVESFQAFSVTYLGSTGQLVANEDDFFDNIPTLYPGDQYSDTLELKNKSGNTIILYFRSDVADQTDDMLKRMTMTIHIENRSGAVTKLYEGPIETDAFAEETEIIRLSAGSSGILHYTISMPRELDNSYTLKHKSILWTFSTDVIPNPVPDAPYTGDSTNSIIYLAGMMFSMIAICILITGKRRRNA